MTISLEKFQYLWGRFKELDTAMPLKERLHAIHGDDAAITYAEVLFQNLDKIWDYKIPQVLKDSDRTALADECAVGIKDGGSDRVKELLLEKSNYLNENQARQDCRDLVWGKLSGIKSDRQANFRVFSNAKGDKGWETFNTTCVMLNPDPWVYSYNYPWKIMEWLKDVHENGTTNLPLVYEFEGVLEHRFVSKYLWMVANAKVIPILSLRSFLNLLPLFKEVWPKAVETANADFCKDFGIHENEQLMDGAFDSFCEQWPKMSSAMCKLLGVAEAEFPAARKEIAEFLFVISLQESAQQDLDVLVEHGNKATVLYGPPGTGKTYTALNYVLNKLGVTGGIDGEDAKDAKRIDDGRVCYVTDVGELTLVQFHPNYSYQDFVGGIFPDTDGEKHIVYEKREGVFKKVCDKAAKDENRCKKFYLLIDEINRADLSSVFGELMYGLEYRNFAMSIPTFGELTIPDNVYVIGTMNNTDKSLVGFDLALRRRFSFLKIPPDMQVLERPRNAVFISQKQMEAERLAQKNGNCGTASDQNDGEDEKDVGHLFAIRAKELNEQLESALHLPAEKQIGHAYFLKVKDFCESVKMTMDAGNVVMHYAVTPYALEQLWTYHIDPLLEEYLGLEYDERKTEITTLKNAFTKELV